ncbi:MAG: hypothetical protein KDH09_03290 [Chrysiogenetes bacterium]|nr:hypothetical protein [Chrysiogenetes bacterium]
MRVAIIYHRVDWECAARMADYLRQYSCEVCCADDKGVRLQGARGDVAEVAAYIGTCNLGLILLARTIDKIDLELQSQVEALLSSGAPAIVLAMSGVEVSAFSYLTGHPVVHLTPPTLVPELETARNAVERHWQQAGEKDLCDNVDLWNGVLGIVLGLSGMGPNQG